VPPVYVSQSRSQPEDIKIIDIAWSLSYHATRWFGKGHTFFPVSQHCCQAFDLASDKNKLAALLHDASEAYLLDLPKPIKGRMPEYQRIEDNLMLAIADKFGFEYPLNEEVKRIDRVLLEDEWVYYVQKNTKHIWDGQTAMSGFLKRFNKL
jgi:5'-deoxynucleotidase YfbR-like HD superfamily hydrolase